MSTIAQNGWRRGETFPTGVLTVSDTGSRGQRADASGDVLAAMLTAGGVAVVQRSVVPDEEDRIAGILTTWADTDGLALIVTSGGTGVSPRDVTPQATLRVLDYEIPGMAEAMRAAGLHHTPHAMISRAVAGVRGRTLIINLPGSPRGVRENLEVVLPALPHALAKIAGDPSECGTIPPPRAPANPGA